MSSFTRFLTVTASTKRRPAVSGGKRGEPVTEIASLTCTPLDPISQDTANRFGINSPVEFKECFTEDLDIVKGDILVVGSEEYPIKFVAGWDWQSTKFKHLVLEDITIG